jgi:hypothetical protein
MNWGPVLIDLFSKFPVVADTAAWVATQFSHLSAVANAGCLDIVQLHRTTGEVNLESQRIPWEPIGLSSFAVLLSCGCILNMMLDEVSLLLLGCNCSSSA